MIVLLLFLASCSIIKNIKLFRAGEVTQENFYQAIGFEERKGYIILKAEIKGETHDFILDTGAPNLISKSLAEKLGLITVSTGKAIDSKGKVGDLEIVSIDTIKLGGLSFTNTSAMVYDIDSIIELYCLDVEGLIGANLMRHAIWDINYKEKKIILTDDVSKLDDTESGLAVDFSTDVQGTPYFHANYEDIKLKNIMFDLGSGGSINITYKSFLEIVEAENT
ncbi:MAG: retropepsin-like aspartic protease, partial [Bacteroidota bacterium]|nr:retropepsin-like aspartic protease [Bacteroidota bacterium]